MFFVCLCYLGVQNVWSLGANSFWRMVDSVASVIPGFVVYITAAQLNLNEVQTQIYWMIEATILYDLVFNGFIGGKILELKQEI